VINVRAVYGVIIPVFVLAGLSGCAEIEPKPFEPSKGHIQSETAGDEADDGAIPDVVTQAPALPEPEPAKPLEKYTVVVNEVPVRELLFALARDADLNVDLYPGLDGNVTLNAVDQTLPQILDRISRQIDIRYEMKDDNIVITPDDPYFKDYHVDYVNMARDTNASNRLSTQISTTGGTGTDGEGGGGGSGGSGGGNNTSTTNIDSVSFNRFWQTMVMNISALIGDPVTGTSGTDQMLATNNVIASPETGILNVRATSTQHELIEQYISQMEESAQRQVLIQATIVEVRLDDRYQAGIDWSALDVFDSGIDLVSSTINPVFPGANAIDGPLAEAVIEFTDTDSSGAVRNTAVVQFLEQFGDTRVLSSPQLMAMNNQTAVLKVVTNEVFFEIDSEVTAGTLGGEAVVSVDTNAQTVPVGIVMAMTPQISQSGVVTLNVRPTISRVRSFKPDPNPRQLAGAENEVPEIEVREMESMLRLSSGQTAILGGLMEDSTEDNVGGVPGVSKLPLIGNLFKTTAKDYRKSELVIFLRPVVVNNPSINADLREYRPFLHDSSADRPGGTTQ